MADTQGESFDGAAEPGAGDGRVARPLVKVRFDPAAMRRESWVDGVIRGAALFVIVVVLLGLTGIGWRPVAALVGVVRPGAAGAAWVGTLETLAGLAVVVGLWVWLATVNARVAATLPELTLAVEARPDAAEAALVRLLARRGMTRWARLMLYQRLAVLRHGQGRFAEAAAVAQLTLTAARPGPAARGRSQLLLVLVESRLEVHDAPGAYLALVELSRTEVTLTEALQRMALRARYELLIGHDAGVLHLAEEKARLSELMPGPQCGGFHAMLALAAARAGDEARRAHWWRRVELLCTAEQVEQLGRMVATSA